MAAPKKAQSFEKSLSRLDDIVKRLEHEDLTLEQSLKLFEEGVKLADDCGKRLDEAEKKVTLLLHDDKGALRQEPFEQDDQED